MTTLPTTRPSIPVSPRPGAPAGAGGLAGAPSVDPIKLVKKYKWLLGGTAVAGLVLGGIAHFVLLRVYPIYRPDVVYQCLPIQTELSVLGNTSNTDKELEKFMATQVAILTSDRIIDKAVSDPKLLTDAPNWASQFMSHGRLDAQRAARSLHRRMSAGVVGETQLIRASFWSNDPAEATAIAKLVGQTYTRDRFIEATKDINERQTNLTSAIKDTEDQIKTLQDRRHRLLQDSSLDSINQENTEAIRRIDALSRKLTEVRADREMFSSQLKQMQAELQSASGPQIPDSIRKRVDDDYEVLHIKDELNALEGRLNGLKKQGILPGNRNYDAIAAQKEGVEQNLRKVRERLERSLFDAQLDSLKVAVDSSAAQELEAQGNLDKAKTRAAETTQIISQVKDIEREIDALTESKTKYSSELKNIGVLSGQQNPSRVVLFQDAQMPKGPAFPKLTIMMPLGLFLCVGLVGGLVLLLEIVDQRVKTPADVAAIPRTRVLGMIPHACEDPTACERIETVFRDRPAGILAENFRQIRGQIVKRMLQTGHKSLLVMSGSPGAGATTTVINIAQSLAAAEHRVLVIDANFRRPGLNKVLGAQEAPGLADVLAGSAAFGECVQNTGTERMDLLAAGTPGARVVERLGSESMANVLKAAGEKYEFVLLDVAPAAVAGDAMALANRCDAVMLVVRALSEKRGMVARLRNELSEVKAEFLGVVVNAVRSAAGGYLKGNILAAHKYHNGGKGSKA
jgi:capsular exopolysaccharide synthesis family protein